MLPQDFREQLLKNGQEQQRNDSADYEQDFFPVVKLFTPDAQCTWLLTELDPHNPDIAFGLCDLGMGFPDIGSVRISELEIIWGNQNLPVERDLYFKAKKTLSEYAQLARENQRIIT